MTDFLQTLASLPSVHSLDDALALMDELHECGLDIVAAPDETLGASDIIRVPGHGFEPRIALPVANQAPMP